MRRACALAALLLVPLMAQPALADPGDATLAVQAPSLVVEGASTAAAGSVTVTAGTTDVTDQSVTVTSRAGIHITCGACADVTMTAGSSTTLPLQVTADRGTASGAATLTATLGAASASADTTLETVPAAPTGVAATQEDGSTTVSFTPGDDGSAGAVTWTVSAGGIAATGTTSPIQVTGLADGTTYTVTVAGSNGVGTGPAATTTARPYAPASAPQHVVATPGDGQLSVAWSPPASNPGVVTSWTATAGGQSATGTGSPLVVTGLTNGTAVPVTVTGHDFTGADTPASDAVSASPYAPPSAPQQVAVAAGPEQLTVSWAPPATNPGVVTGWVVTAQPDDGGQPVTVSAAGSPVTLTGLTDGRAYDVTVAATDGPASAPVTATPLTVPGAPGQPQVLAGDGVLVASWARGSDGGSPVTAWTATATPVGGGAAVSASGPGSPLRIAGLTDGTAYVVSVSARNAAGDGPAGPASEAQTPQGRMRVVLGTTVAALTSSTVVQLKGRVLHSDGSPVAGQLVQLSHTSTVGHVVTPLGTVTTDGSGSYSLHVRLLRTGTVTASTQAADADGSYAASARRTLSVAATVAIASVSRSGSQLVVRGALTPGQTVKGSGAYARLSLWTTDAHGRRLARIGRGTATKGKASSAFRITVTTTLRGPVHLVVVVDQAAQDKGGRSPVVTSDLR